MKVLKSEPTGAVGTEKSRHQCHGGSSELTASLKGGEESDCCLDSLLPPKEQRYSECPCLSDVCGLQLSPVKVHRGHGAAWWPYNLLELAVGVRLQSMLSAALGTGEAEAFSP